MYRKALALSSLMFVLAACGGDAEEAPEAETMEEGGMAMEEEAAPMVEGVGTQAVARMINDQGTEIGTVNLTQQEDGVEIEIDLAFLQGGARAFHIHETGTCEAPDFSSAGGHFNPGNVEHGTESSTGPHAGDLENVDVYPDDGTVVTTMRSDRITLAEGQPNSLMDADGSAFVVHQGADDYSSQPSGDAGPRIACGVVEPA